MNDDDRACITGYTTLAQLEMQGMIAANQERELHGQAMAYPQAAFVHAYDELKLKLARHMVVL